MPPKKAGSKKKDKKKAAEPAPDDGLNVGDLSREELEGKVLRLRDELDREREERNYFQLERDKINTFWEITKKQLEEARANQRNKDREMEEAEERHAVEIKVYKQKVKHLLYEHQNQIAELKMDAAMNRKVAQDEFHEEGSTLRRDARSLKVELKELELSHQDMVKNLQLEYDKRITELHEQMQLQAKEIRQKYEQRMDTLREDLELQRKAEIHEIEERKNGQISALMRNHEKAFGDIKNYYNDITLNNLALINTLKEQVEEMKRKEERTEKLMGEITAENRKLVEPLREAKSRVTELEKQLASYTQDKQFLRTSKAQLKVQQDTIQHLEWELEVLKQRFGDVEAERDELYDRFVRTIYDVQQKSGFKNLVLEKKLAALSESLEKKEAQLNEVLLASNLDPTALSVVTKKLEDVLDGKNQAIRDLEYELARMCKTHNDTVRAFEAKMQDMGVPAEELGFTVVANDPDRPLGQGPAGLVAT